MALFTASKFQVATYLLGVCPFSIAFLVFLNSSVSFVVTDLIGRDSKVGEAVGNLGFADELVALAACPLWGLLSDRVGVRTVCFMGYAIIGTALFVFVQAKNVYPELLLGRLFFSIGGAAASTMVTAVLPAMSYVESSRDDSRQKTGTQRTGEHAQAPSIASEQTITPANYRDDRGRNVTASEENAAPDTSSKIAGFVGMATGCGALLALGLFLPLPARFQKGGTDPGRALQYSYYIVGAVALALAAVCLIGLQGLRSEQKKSWRVMLSGTPSSFTKSSIWGELLTYASYLYQAFLVGFIKKDIFVGYIGGFVARASSVAISLFVPLLVNAAFLSSGLCEPSQVGDDPTGLPDIKRRCPRAYTLAAELTGVSQLVALICAPLFGWWSSRMSNKTVPIMFSAVSAIIGYPLFANCFDPDDENKVARAVSFVAVCLIGMSQIGAIVCSLAILSSGILKQPQNDQKVTGATEAIEPANEEQTAETPLLHDQDFQERSDRVLTDLKGSVAGIYSFYGGAGILLLTKAGGALFDSTSRAAPFYMMATFNGILLIAVVTVSLIKFKK